MSIRPPKIFDPWIRTESHESKTIADLIPATLNSEPGGPEKILQRLNHASSSDNWLLPTAADTVVTHTTIDF
jgi:hypothetical protein